CSELHATFLDNPLPAVATYRGVQTGKRPEVWQTLPRTVHGQAVSLGPLGPLAWRGVLKDPKILDNPLMPGVAGGFRDQTIEKRVACPWFTGRFLHTRGANCLASLVFPWFGWSGRR